MQIIIEEGIIEEKDRAKPPDTSAESFTWTPPLNNETEEQE